MKRYHGDDYTFIINRVKLEDRGEYIIRAENHYGYREEVVFLNVQRKHFHRQNFIYVCDYVILGENCNFQRSLIFLMSLDIFRQL